ncbi:diphthamide biosynthesis enzyme Dph2 [Candidatus Micrarchaeota archaeon]|nr:diphthamide biosynthesis enzyme Dph2 [Candidatus Micrarchaeota archaeon]
MRILLQFPEGLKKEALKHAERYGREGHEVFLSGSACYGACDLALDEAKAIKADKIVHFGHAPFLRSKLPLEVEYVEYHIDANLEAVKRAVKEIKESKIALGTTVQHIHQLGGMRRIFESLGKRVFTGKGALAYHEGQVLGCDSAAVTQFEEAEAIVIVGDGMFHAMGIMSGKPVYVIHPQSGAVRNIAKEIEKYGKRRKGAIAKALECGRFAILLSTKPGQFHPELAKKMKRGLEGAGKTAEIIVANEFSPNTLANFTEFECYVNTACPRIADDSEAFGKPILNPDMVAEMLQMLRGLRPK